MRRNSEKPIIRRSFRINFLSVFRTNLENVRVLYAHAYMRTMDGTRGRVLYLECSRNYF